MQDDVLGRAGPHGRQPGRVRTADGENLYEQILDSFFGGRSRTMRLLGSGLVKIGAVNQRTDMTSELLIGIGVNARDECAEAQQVPQADPGLELPARCLGRFDMIATVGSGSLRRHNALIDKLRTLPQVGHVETWLHVRITRENYDHDLPTVRSTQPTADHYVACLGDQVNASRTASPSAAADR